MYIRTKDGVYEVSEKTKYAQYSIRGMTMVKNADFQYISNENILKQSDSIEELCDEFVYIEDGIASQYLTIDFKFKREDEYCSLRNKLTANGIAEISKGISKYELENGELKFAIWTDKGLIYVAKMNDKGELVLI